MMLQYTLAQSLQDLEQILTLQQQNLASNISKEEALAQGFVTVKHDLQLLKEMNRPHPHIIAKADGQVVGYALVMLRALADEIPVLIPMFEQINTINYTGIPLSQSKYFIMGQVCIAKSYRGQGVFRGLYEEMSRRMSGHFDYIVTEISSRNHRSLRAHAKVGFETLKKYQAVDGEPWEIVLLKI